MDKLFFFLVLVSSAVIYSDRCSVSFGGTGLVSATAYSVLCGGTTSTGDVQPVGYTSAGDGLAVLTSNGASALPSFLPLREFAYVYTRTGATIAAGGAMLFELNGIMSSGIVHSTSSNTDQITINRAGTYLMMCQANTTSTQISLSVTVDGVSVAASQTTSTSAAGGILANQCIVTVTAGQIIKVVNFSASAMTITVGTGRVCGSITIMQIA